MSSNMTIVELEKLISDRWPHRTAFIALTRNRAVLAIEAEHGGLAVLGSFNDGATAYESVGLATARCEDGVYIYSLDQVQQDYVAVARCSHQVIYGKEKESNNNQPKIY